MVNHYYHRTWVAAAGLLMFFPGAGLRGEDPAVATLPVKRVVMFSSGVAFYERSGEIAGNSSVDLRFNTRDINDLLKSMVLQDLGGGKISTVSYGSKDPITRTLRTFSIDLTQNPTLADLLSQIRGEKIEIDAQGALTGVIVGIEKRTKPAGMNETMEVSYLNILTEDGLRSVALDSVGKIKLSNPQLNAELKQALLVLAMGKSVDKKSVTLNFTGEGKRPVQVGYIQESPIWKTSYRLVLSDEKPLLQGWAIVENTTEEDWENVNLTLVSGRPISFVMDLYQPLYIDRPIVQQELYASLRPRTYDQDLAESDKEFRKAAADPGAPANRPGEQSGKRSGEGLARQRGAEMQKGGFGGRGFLADGRADERNFKPGTSVESVAQASDVGEMFQYRIATPVKLGRQKSAMLPIVNDSVEGEKVSIYNAAVHAKHPLHGLKLKNSTDLHLMQGPITVFDEGAYAGDAQIQDLPPGSERLLSYAMDLDTEVAPTSNGEPEQLLSVKLVQGNLHSVRKFGRVQTYVIKNSGKKAKKVLVEYPLDTAWTLTEPKDPTEKTRDMYRIAVAAEPGKPENLTLREERTASEQVALSNLDDGTITFYINAKVVSEKVKEALAGIIKRKQAQGLLVAKRTELERQVTVIFDEQNRIRQNMAQLPKDSDLFRRYVTKFNEQEDKIDGLREQIKAAIADEAQGRQDLDKFLLELDLS